MVGAVGDCGAYDRIAVGIGVAVEKARCCDVQREARACVVAVVVGHRVGVEHVDRHPTDVGATEAVADAVVEAVDADKAGVRCVGEAAVGKRGERAVVGAVGDCGGDHRVAIGIDIAVQEARRRHIEREARAGVVTVIVGHWRTVAYRARNHRRRVRRHGQPHLGCPAEHDGRVVLQAGAQSRLW